MYTFKAAVSTVPYKWVYGREVDIFWWSLPPQQRNAIISVLSTRGCKGNKITWRRTPPILRGVELSGLGPSGMIFFITPTGQFLLGFFYYKELFTFDKLISFILIWIAVIIYLNDLNNKKL